VVFYSRTWAEVRRPTFQPLFAPQGSGLANGPATVATSHSLTPPAVSRRARTTTVPKHVSEARQEAEGKHPSIVSLSLSSQPPA
jgi:hypothetical protein